MIERISLDDLKNGSNNSVMEKRVLKRTRRLSPASGACSWAERLWGHRLLCFQGDGTHADAVVVVADVEPFYDDNIDDCFSAYGDDDIAHCVSDYE